ncbi:MAG: HD domain-containing protein [Burkholderiales bacterium]|nr:HD domain-containing protein [Burkholderiales bacterium]
MIQRKLYPGDVFAGQILPWDVFNGRGTLLLSKGQTVQSDEQIRRLHKEGMYVEVEQVWHQDPGSVLQHILHACWRMETILLRPESTPQFVDAVSQIADMIGAAARKAPDVVVATVVLRQGGRYAVRHVVDATSIVACVLDNIGVGPEQMRPLLCAALTMNISAMDLHETLAHQASPLTPSQEARIQNHPLASAERLRKLGVANEAWLAAVAQHHESFAGNGYPRRLRQEQISDGAQLIGLADLFCARVRERDYRRADSTRMVLRDILIERGRNYDSRLAAYFIRSLGVYPSGTLVLLANSEIGVVRSRTDKIDAPWVSLLATRDGKMQVTGEFCDTRTPGCEIVDVMSPLQHVFDIDMELIWGSDARDFSLAEREGQLFNMQQAASV